MSLLNPLASAEQVAWTPSGEDGISRELEEDLRAYGCQLIQQAGMALKLPQVAMATAQVLFQRFWFVTSLKQFSIRDIGMGALFLASKLEECPIRLRDLVNAYDYLIRRAQHSSKHPTQLPSSSSTDPSSDASAPPFHYNPMGYFDAAFYDAKDDLVIAEMQILKRLGFNVQVNLPYATMVNYLQVLELADHDEVPQKAWGYLNDALLTPVYCLYPPTTIATAAVYLSCLTCDPPISLPLEPQPWYELFDASLADIRSICGWILRLYHPKAQAGRIREGTGGLVHMVEKKGVREWLEKDGDGAEKTPDEGRS